jgi:hypothetical protein
LRDFRRNVGNAERPRMKIAVSLQSARKVSPG